MNPLLEAALARARDGAYIIPLWSTDAAGVCKCPKKADCASPGKHPRTMNGLDDASCDPDTIKRWWGQWPDANVGVRTDAVVRIDIDLPDVAEALSADVPLQAETELVRTPRRGGLHIALKVLRPVAGRDLFLSDGRKLGELKAARGYVLVPPSAIGTGEYQLLSPDGNDPIEVDDPVAWLRNVLPAFGYNLAGESERPARAYEALSGAVYEGEGRHNALVSYSGKVWVEGMAPETLASVLQAVNEAQCRPPLPPEEVRQIAQHFIEHRAPRVIHDPVMVGDANRPSILVTNRYRRDIADDAWRALLAANDPVRFFRHGNSVAEIDLHDDGSASIRHLGTTGLAGRIDRCADFIKITQTGRHPARPPRDVVEDMEALENPLPRLRGIVGAPVFAADGTLETAMGYQPRTGLYYAPIGEPVQAVPLRPDTTDLRAARLRLGDDLLGDFPWADEHASLANLVAALITPMVRELVTGPVPLFALDAPKAGNGKGLLASCISLVATGHEIAVMADTKSEEEFRKRVTTKLMEGDGVLLFDNVRRRLDSGAFAALLTANVWTDRVLGRSQAVTLPIRSLFLVTGNNLQFSDEITRRVVSVRIDAKIDRPWEGRAFRHSDLTGWLRRHRHEVVWACLVLAQNWIAQGRPQWSGSPMGSYESWCCVLGGILQAAGIDGFLENRPDLYRRGDTDSEEWRAFTSAWWGTHRDAAVKVADLQPIAEETLTSFFDQLKAGADNKTIRTKLGKAIAERQDTRFENLFVRRAGADGHSKTALWCVERAAPSAGDAAETETTPAPYPQDYTPFSDLAAGDAGIAGINSDLLPHMDGRTGVTDACGERGDPYPQYPPTPQTDSDEAREDAGDTRVTSQPATAHPQCKRCRVEVEATATSNLCNGCRRDALRNVMEGQQ